MKHILSFALILIMVFSLAACKTSSQSAAADPTAEPAPAEQTTEPTEEQDPTSRAHSRPRAYGARVRGLCRARIKAPVGKRRK